jgi:hypothetical protein
MLASPELLDLAYKKLAQDQLACSEVQQPAEMRGLWCLSDASRPLLGFTFCHPPWHQVNQEDAVFQIRVAQNGPLCGHVV